jgi:hypothetical protein
MILFIPRHTHKVYSSLISELEAVAEEPTDLFLRFIENVNGLDYSTT